MTYLVALVSIALGAVGQFLLKVGAGRLPTGGSTLSTIWSMALTPSILLGLLCFGASFVSWVFVLRKLELSVAYPMVSLSYLITAGLASLYLREPLNLHKVSGLALILLGVLVLNAPRS